MKFRLTGKICIALALLSLLLFVFGCRNVSRREKPDTKITRHIYRGSSAQTQNMDELNGVNHPYGKPVSQGTLRWERDFRFKSRYESEGMKVRMAAFRTTLPDPLPGEEANVALAADMLAGKVVRPGEVFSMNRTIGPYTKARGFRDGPAYIGGRVIKTTGGGVCKIATTLYNVAVLSNFKILERHPHGMPVPYVPPGQDATVAEGSKDFRFANNTPEPVLLWADTQGNTLTIAVYGREKPPAVTWRHQILKRWPTRTVYRQNKKLKPGMKKVIVPGADGMIVKSLLMVKYQNGDVMKRDLGTDVYQPLPHVIEKG